MFFKKTIKKLNDTIKDIEKNIDGLTRCASRLTEENEKIKNILHFHAHGEIRGYSVMYGQPSPWDFGKSLKTFIYKDGNEYVFNGLYIEEPKFSQGIKENIVYALSGDEKHRYVLDIYKNKFIEIEQDVNEKAP